MTPLTLPAEVADALTAVCAVDGTDPAELAGLIVADWLETLRPRVTIAAEALDRLANGDHPPEPDPLPSSWHACDECDKSFRTSHGLKVHRSRMHRTRRGGRARAAVQQCDVCAGRDGRHAAWCAERRTDSGEGGAASAAADPEGSPEVPPPDGPAGPCGVCRSHAAMPGKAIEGVAVCLNCWRDAGRPAA